MTISSFAPIVTHVFSKFAFIFTPHLGRQHVEPSPQRILVVDDEEAIRETVSTMVEALGYAVQVVGDAAAALSLLESSPSDIVISDIRMPGMDGLSLIKEIKERFPDTDIISMTGYGSSYSYTSVIRAGASDFIVKPFGLDEIEAKLSRLVRERTTREELKKTNEELLKLSIKDDLTSLYNRRYFYTKLEGEMNRAKRQRRSLFLIMFDLDHFKQYNDTYGHVKGDQLLKGVGRAVRSSIRKNVDAAFRYGGDEFTIIVPEANREQTLKVAERTRQACRELTRFPIDLSVGLAELKDDYDVETFVASADKAMYEAKHSRDRKIVIFGQE